MAVSASPQFTRQGVTGIPDAEILRVGFKANGRLILPALACYELIAMLAQSRAQGAWTSLAGDRGMQLLEDEASSEALHFLVASPSFLGIVGRITAGTLSSFRGQTFRLLPWPDRNAVALQLHPDDSSTLGLLVNLDRSPITLEFPDDPDIWNRQLHLHAGDALLYRSPRSRDGCTPLITSAGANTVFHGWFYEAAMA